MRPRVAFVGLALLLACDEPTVVVATLEEVFEAGFVERTLEVDGEVRAYTVYVPPAYDPDAAWPLIVFLHGGGQRGRDGLQPTQVGLGPHLIAAPGRWPAVGVFPQIADGEVWQHRPARVALAAIDSALTEFHIDTDRIYLTGLSLGANGTWYLGFQDPDRFAALVPIAGSVTGFPRVPAFIPGPQDQVYSRIADRLSDVPIWIFHGDQDPEVPVSEARGMAGALESVGGDVRYDELDGVGHNAWDRAYSDPRLAEWLFSQHRE